MCLAIYKPAGIDVPENHLRNGFESNNDGCGLCWAADGELHVKKGMMKWDEFYKLYQDASQYPMLIHFRKSTHGKKDGDNCHPFLFNDGKLALIHNGVIPIKCVNEGYSDTWHFVHNVLAPIVKEHNVPIDDQSLSWFIRVSIGTDKIVVMDQAGEVIIFNEDKGNWEDVDGKNGKGKGKIWYSNYSFRYMSTRSSSIGNHNSANSGNVVAEEDEGEWAGYGHLGGQHTTAAATTPLATGDTEIATDENRGPGKMTEYGWFDAEIEEEIKNAQKMGLSREDAIVQVFNNA